MSSKHGNLVIGRKWTFGMDRFGQQKSRLWIETIEDPNLVHCYRLIYRGKKLHRYVCIKCNTQSKYSTVELHWDENGLEYLYENVNHDDGCKKSLQTILDDQQKLSKTSHLLAKKEDCQVENFEENTSETFSGAENQEDADKQETVKVISPEASAGTSDSKTVELDLSETSGEALISPDNFDELLALITACASAIQAEEITKPNMLDQNMEQSVATEPVSSSVEPTPVKRKKVPKKRSKKKYDSDEDSESEEDDEWVPSKNETLLFDDEDEIPLKKSLRKRAKMNSSDSDVEIIGFTTGAKVLNKSDKRDLVTYKPSTFKVPNRRCETHQKSTMNSKCGNLVIGRKMTFGMDRFGQQKSRLWIETIEDPNLVHCYRLIYRGKKLHRYVCIKCNTQSKYSTVELHWDENGLEYLYENVNHDDGCKKSLQTILHDQQKLSKTSHLLAKKEDCQMETCEGKIFLHRQEPVELVSPEALADASDFQTAELDLPETSAEVSVSSENFDELFALVSASASVAEKIAEPNLLYLPEINAEEMTEPNLLNSSGINVEEITEPNLLDFPGINILFEMVKIIQEIEQSATTEPVSSSVGPTPVKPKKVPKKRPKKKYDSDENSESEEDDEWVPSKNETLSADNEHEIPLKKTLRKRAKMNFPCSSSE